MFYHYTCRHRAKLIGRYGTILPHPQPLMGGIPLVWLTDTDRPDKEALGLTSHTLACDRTERRYIVEAALGDVIPWAAARAAGLGALMIRTVGANALIAFEEGRSPERWFVSMRSLPARLDRRYRSSEAA